MPPQLLPVGRFNWKVYFIVWFPFKEKLSQSRFETGASVSSFLASVEFIDIIKITYLIDTVGEPKAFNQLSVSPEGCCYARETDKC